MKRILVAEDEAPLRDLYSLVFKKAGYDVKAVANAKDAVSEAHESNFDCIVLDIRMPGMDGIEGMQRILADGKRCPIVLNTAYTLYKNDFATWSADAYVLKSSDVTELVTTVNRLTGL